MITDWIGRLLRRRAHDPRPPPRSSLAPIQERRRGAPPIEGGAGSRSTDRREVLDLRSIAEYNVGEREPLHPRDMLRLQPLQGQVRERLADSARSALPFPDSARRLIQRGGSQRDVNGLVQLLHQDPVLSAYILRVANSASHAGLGEARGIREAVMRLGTEAAWQIAMTAAVHTVLDRESNALHDSLRSAWRFQWSHAMLSAATAGWLALTCRQGDVEHVFLAGLLHDIGKIYALHGLSDLLREGRLADPLRPALLEALLEGTHVELGRDLAMHWRLPVYIASVCAGHHDEKVAAGDLELHVVRVVSGLDELRRNPWHHPGLVGEVLESAGALDLDAVRLRAVLAELRDATARAQPPGARERATSPPPT